MLSSRALVAGLTTVAFLCGPSASGQDVVKETVPGIVNLARVETTVACAGTVDSSQAMPRIKQMGFASIIDLRQASEPGANIDQERQAAEAAGLRYVHVPFDGSSPDPKAADAFLAAIRTPGTEPAFIHCVSGNRAAAMWLIKRLVVDRWDAERATKEAGELGLRSAALRQFALDYAQKQKPNEPVTIVRLPEGAIQPQVALDAQGRAHVLYFRGEPAHGDGDLFYTRLNAQGRFTPPLQVNALAGSATATGTIRGGHLAIGQNGRVHVAWHGSSVAPKVGDSSPVFYTRMNDAGTRFEPGRNVVQQASGLDGGTVAADAAGHVYVSWHAGVPGMKGEADRRVWVARSADGGRTFAAETPASDQALGACGCCGLGALTGSRGELYVLFRSAVGGTHRDTHLLTSTDAGVTYSATRLQNWEIAACPMSSYALARTGDGVLAAWETDGQIYWTTIDSGPAVGTQASRPVASAPGAARNRKHPAIAANARGEVLLAWTEGTGWNKGGELAWQRFDRAGKAIGDVGRAPGVPVWSLAAVAPTPDGGFTILY